MGALHQLLLRPVRQPARAQQYRVEPQRLCRARLRARLLRFAARARHAHQRFPRARLVCIHLLFRHTQDRLEQAHLRFADLELRGVHRHCQPAHPSVQIIPDQRALARLVEFPVFVQNQRDGRDDRAPVQDLQRFFMPSHTQ